MNTGSSPVGITKFKLLDQYIGPLKQEWLACSKAVNVKGHREVTPMALATFPLSISEMHGSALKARLAL
ncbi:hypothetical protein KS18_12345 [Photorhabdus luminescens]|nr:hypothetical protein KS18_12345 [Photorhabdus luminescens]